MERSDRDRLSHATTRAAVNAAVWVAVIYATIPLVRTFQGWYSRHFDEIWITVFMLAAIAVAVGVVVARLRRARIRLDAVGFVWLCLVAGTAGWITWRLRDRPEEALHLLEYGILTVLLYKALRPRETDLAVVAHAVLLTAIMGVVDEAIQWITPLRFFDFRDIGLNGGAGLLAAIGIWRLDPGPWRRPDVASVRAMLHFGTVLFVLLILCFANTPDRVAWYSARIPGLGFLSHPANEMAEYGHRIEVPEIGTFKSRLTMDELIRQDRVRGAEVAEILARYPEGEYARFIREHQGFQDPLLYEARIHLFSRDANVGLSREAEPGSADRVEHASRAFREQRITEEFFPVVTNRSGFSMSPKGRRALESDNDPDWVFSSKVSAHLITRWTERELRLRLLAVVVVLVALDLALGARAQRKETTS